MTHPYSSQPAEERPQGFSYEPGNVAPVTGVPLREGMGFATPPREPRRPGTLTAAIVLLWVLAGLTVLFALVLVLLVLLSAVQPRHTPAGTANLVTAVFAALLLAAFAALMMVAAIRLPRKADSARVLALTLMGFFVFSNLTYILLASSTIIAGHPQAMVRSLIGIFLSLLLGAMPGVVIVLLSLKKSVAWFYETSAVEAEGPR